MRRNDPSILTFVSIISGSARSGLEIFIGIRVLMIPKPNSEVFLVKKSTDQKLKKINPFLIRQVLPFSYIFGINRTEKHCVYIGAKLG